MKHNYSRKLKNAANKFKTRETDILNCALFNFFNLNDHEKENAIYCYKTVGFCKDYADSWHENYNKKKV